MSDELPESMQELMLKDFNYIEIYEYDMSQHQHLSDLQCQFLLRHSLVLQNNYADKKSKPISRMEAYIHEMSSILMKACHLDDGRYLVMKHVDRVLKIGENSYAAQADREGRRGLG